MKLRDYLSPIESNTSYLHLNIQCLPAKFDSFVSFLNTLTDRKETNFPSVIALSETWLNASNCSLYDINGYHSFLSNNRTDNSSRWGVGFYLRNDIDYIERPDLTVFISNIYETLFITLEPIMLTVGVIYSTPDSNKEEFLFYFEKSLNQLKEKNEHFILLGDFNVNLLKYGSDSIATDFANLTFEQACIPLITKPTRIDIH